MIITGYEVRKGTFNNIDYDNVILYQQLNCSGKGFKTRAIKVKHKFLDNWMSENQISGLDYLIDMDLEFYYDNYDNVAVIQELAPVKKK